jgi:hypothetical protein
MPDTFPHLRKTFRSQLEEVEGSLNRLYGAMSPQLEDVLEWRRSRLLELILDLQLKEFDRCESSLVQSS